ncbi:MAG: cation transporter, partial [Lachnospiraceae bacterium]|nr:cation transporter [Lachnospiraceae bacterium]
KITGISLEAWVGIVISVFIIKAGIEMMTETLDEILGSRADKELTAKIKEILNSEPEVKGAFDLIIYNFGPDRNYASVHLELPDTMTAKEVDKLTRKMENKVYKETGVVLAGMGLYSYNTENDEAGRIEKDVREKVLAHEWALQLHGFYLDVESKEMTFDVVMSFDIVPKEGLKTINEEIRKAYPEYRVNIVPDVDISD